MFDNIGTNFNNINFDHIDKQQKVVRGVTFKQKPDEFVKSAGSEEQKNISPQEMAKIFARYNYVNIVNELTENNNCFLFDGSIDLRSVKNSTPCVLVQINNDLGETQEVYRYSKQEFLDLLNLLQQKAIENSPEKAEKFMMLHSQLLEKIESEFE